MFDINVANIFGVQLGIMAKNQSLSCAQSAFTQPSSHVPGMINSQYLRQDLFISTTAF
jgi:hypothetical protein